MKIVMMMMTTTRMMMVMMVMMMLMLMLVLVLIKNFSAARHIRVYTKHVHMLQLLHELFHLLLAVRAEAACATASASSWASRSGSSNTRRAGATAAASRSSWANRSRSCSRRAGASAASRSSWGLLRPAVPRRKPLCMIQLGPQKKLRTAIVFTLPCEAAPEQESLLSLSLLSLQSSQVSLRGGASASQR